MNNVALPHLLSSKTIFDSRRRFWGSDVVWQIVKGRLLREHGIGHYAFMLYSRLSQTSLWNKCQHVMELREPDNLPRVPYLGGRWGPCGPSLAHCTHSVHRLLLLCDRAREVHKNCSSCVGCMGSSLESCLKVAVNTRLSWILVRESLNCGQCNLWVDFVVLWWGSHENCTCG